MHFVVFVGSDAAPFWCFFGYCTVFNNSISISCLAVSAVGREHSLLSNHSFESRACFFFFFSFSYMYHVNVFLWGGLFDQGNPVLFRAIEWNKKKTTKEFVFRLPWLVLLGLRCWLNHHQSVAGWSIKMKSHFYHKLYSYLIMNHLWLSQSFVDTGWSIKK